MILLLQTKIIKLSLLFVILLVSISSFKMIQRRLLVLVQLISHAILNVVVDDEVELFFCKAVMLGEKQGLYVYFVYFFRKIDCLRQDIQYVGIVDDGVEV